MANFYLSADGCQETAASGKYTDQVDGTLPMARYFAVNMKYLGAHVSSNLFCYVKQISEPPSKKEMDSLFMACLLRSKMVKNKDDRSILTMIDIMALATHNLRSLAHYEMILRMISWNDDTKNSLDKIFVKSDQSTKRITKFDSRNGIRGETVVPRSSLPANHGSFLMLREDKLSYNNAGTVLALISCIHFYYSSLWTKLYAKYEFPGFEPDWITASKPVCDKARSRYWAAVNEKTRLDKLAGTGASISEPGPSFTRWRVPVGGSDQWECN